MKKFTNFFCAIIIGTALMLGITNEITVLRAVDDVALVSNEEEFKTALDNSSISTIKLKNDLSLSEAPKIKRKITIEGEGFTINTGLSIYDEVNVNNLVFEPDKYSHFSDFYPSSGYTIIGIRKGALIADNIEVIFTRKVSLNSKTLTGISNLAGTTINVENSKFNLTEDKDTHPTENKQSVIYGIYTQANSNATKKSSARIVNNIFNLSGEKATYAVGTQFRPSETVDLTLSGNKLNVIKYPMGYELRVYVDGRNEGRMEEGELHAWVDTQLDKGQQSRLQNSGDLYPYPIYKDVEDLVVKGVDKVYDNNTYTINFDEENLIDNDLVEYSTDGGITWWKEKPVFKEAGEYEVIVRVTNTNYLDRTSTATIKIAKKDVKITVNDDKKVSGEDDPIFDGIISGLVEDSDLVVKYVRVGSEENVGVYKNVLTAQFEDNPNYEVTIENGDFQIIEKTEDEDTPLVPLVPSTPIEPEIKPVENPKVPNTGIYTGAMEAFATVTVAAAALFVLKKRK